MPFVHSNGIELCYDEVGERDAPPLVLIMGLGRQLVDWDDSFCEMLAARAQRVIRFDNRDAGLSSKFTHLGEFPAADTLAGLSQGRAIRAPYLLEDMAFDVVGLLDGLGIERAHVLGTSLGAGILQELVIRHPERVRSATCLMGTTGDPNLPPAKPEAAQVLIRQVPDNEDEAVQNRVRTAALLAGPAYPSDPEGVGSIARRAYRRGIDPAGAARQLAAMCASGSRREPLAGVTTPMLVIHGDADPLIPVACGIDIAECVPGATLHIIEGLGHTLPAALWGTIADLVAEHARGAV